MDEILDDGHLEDRGFYVEVEHPELGRKFIYPGAAAIYNGSPWKISRRPPLIGEHNQEIPLRRVGSEPQRTDNPGGVRGNLAGLIPWWGRYCRRNCRLPTPRFATDRQEWSLS